MKSVVAVGLIAGVLLGSAPAAMAQEAVLKGTRSTERTGATTFRQNFESREIMGDPTKALEIYSRSQMVAKCVARLAGDEARGLLGGELTDDLQYRNLSRALERRYEQCSESDPNLPAILISGVLAEELVHAGGTADFEDRAQSVDVNEAEEFYGGFDGQVTMQSIAGCLAVYSPGMVYDVLSVKNESPEEIAALDSLYAATPECRLSAPPADIARIYQRGALATALYEWTHRNS